MAARARSKSNTPKKRRRRVASRPTTAKRGDLPPLRLSPDEMAQRRAAEAQRQGWSRELDRLQIAADRGWPSKPARAAVPKPPPPKAAGKRRGPKRIYDYEAIRRVAEELPRPHDKHKYQFFNKVRDKCETKRIKAPDDDRSMRRIVGDLHVSPSEARRAD